MYEGDRRLCIALLFVRAAGQPTDNGYAHPLDGVIVVVDANKMEGTLGSIKNCNASDNSLLVLEVEEHTERIVTMVPGNYSKEYIAQRKSLKPLEIIQPEGANFLVSKH